MVRVSSAAMTVAASSASTRRRDASPRLPIGVAARMITRPSLRLEPVTRDRLPLAPRAAAAVRPTTGGPSRVRRADPAARRACGRWLGSDARRRCSPAILRLWNLGHPHAFIFDETYYVKDAWTLWQLGYEAILARRTRTRASSPATRHLHDRPAASSCIRRSASGSSALGMVAVRRRIVVGAGASRPRSLGTAAVLVLYFVAQAADADRSTFADGRGAPDGDRRARDRR